MVSKSRRPNPHKLQPALVNNLRVNKQHKKIFHTILLILRLAVWHTQNLFFLFLSFQFFSFRKGPTGKEQSSAKNIIGREHFECQEELRVWVEAKNPHASAKSPELVLNPAGIRESYSTKSHSVFCSVRWEAIPKLLNHPVSRKMGKIQVILKITILLSVVRSAAPTHPPGGPR